MSEANTTEPGLSDANVQALVTSASRWMRQALTGWADDDNAVVAMLAPIAVEHLGKALLWCRHPALLVPLASNAEESLHLLTGHANLAHPKLRTIGLAVVMQRLERCLDPFPLDKDSIRRLNEVRNGSVHVGAKDASRQVLVDTLSLCDSLLTNLGLAAPDFYAEQDGNVRGLLARKGTEVEAAVEAKRARARNHLSLLEERLGAEVFRDTTYRLAEEGRAVVDPERFGSSWDTVAIDRQCPECGSKARLVGRLDADAEPDWDVEEINGVYETYLAGTAWNLTLAPQALVCNVCRLELLGPDELRAAGLPAQSYELDLTDMDDDFDISDFARGPGADID